MYKWTDHVLDLGVKPSEFCSHDPFTWTCCCVSDEEFGNLISSTRAKNRDFDKLRLIGKGAFGEVEVVS